jgi:hypothetical protein
LRQVEPLFGKMNVEFEPLIWILRDPDLVGFIGGQEIAFSEQLPCAQYK